MNSTINDKSSLKRLSMAGLLVTLGIVFGDIGTSPLYVMKAIESVTLRLLSRIYHRSCILRYLDSDIADYNKIRIACLKSRQ